MLKNGIKQKNSILKLCKMINFLKLSQKKSFFSTVLLPSKIDIHKKIT